MERIRKQTILLVLAVLLCTISLHAGFSFEFDFVSAFIWRGMDVYNNKPAIQPSVTYAFDDSGLSVNVWGSYVLTGNKDYREMSEVDITVNYDFRVSENISLSVGFINYGFWFMPDYTFKDGNTQEFYISAGLPRALLSPSVSIYYDINLGSGLYVEFSGGHSFALTDRVGLEFNASLGYNSKSFIDESGISDLNISASVPFSIDNVRMTPSVHYTHVYLEPFYFDGIDKDKFWFSINLVID
jgi:uncharacterized protein (TIGR02001 family)